MQDSKMRPLCVDLDGSLIRSDILWESLFQLTKAHPLKLFLLPWWLLKGKAFFKARIAEAVELDPQLLPYCEELLDFLHQQRSEGRELILATAANEKPARTIADHLGIFDRVYASDAENNLSGSRKLQMLVADYGEQGFDYVGNAKVDLDIWPKAAEGILVNPHAGVETAAVAMDKAQRVIKDQQGGIKTILRAMRLHQWTKNLLVFIPLALAHRAGEPELLLQALLAFLAFGLCASSVYLLNDLLDLPADRRHPSKRNRPFARGDLSVETGARLLLGLLLASIAIASTLPMEFAAALGIYYATTMAYSLRLKQAPMVDVLILAALYTLRILGGAAAVTVEPSFWLLAFSMFFFLSLALVKRYSELLLMQGAGNSAGAGRGYSEVDMETLAQFGTASGYMSILVLALYISSEDVIKLYQHPKAIWLLCPLLLYWISHVWLLTRRNKMHEDPVVFAISDRRSYIIGVLAVCILYAAI